MIAVTYYGKIALSYLIGPWVHKPYNWLYCGFIFLVAMLEVEVAWSIGDLVNGLMAFTNLIGVLGLSGLAVRMVRTYLREHDSLSKNNPLSGAHT